MTTTMAPQDATRPRDRKASTRLIAAAILGGVIVLFAALNSQTVRIHWIVTTTSLPLIVVILGCALLGLATGWLVARRRSGR